LWTLCALLLTMTHAWAQGSTTGTIRGTIQDPTGGVLPGATVTLINEGTKATQVAVSDGEASILAASSRHLRHESRIVRFKSDEQTAIAISPNDNRGIDIRLEVGQQSETVTVTSQAELIQTETGAREGLLRSRREPVGHRPERLELMRILPASSPNPTWVSWGASGRGNNTQGHTVNGSARRGHGVADGSSLIDIGNSAPSSPEQRHGSGSEGAELELAAGMGRRHERQRRH
jgi:hypothetical protein